jgi:REP element-mobilizing transposase RayT
MGQPMPIPGLPRRKRIRLPAAAYRTGEPFLLTLCAASDTEPFRVLAVARRVVTRLDAATATRTGFILAWCLMPDHLHAVIAGAPDVVAWAGVFKAQTTKDVQSLGWTGPLWQRSFHDRGLRDDGASIERAVRYVLDNPVRAGLVMHVDDWPYWGVTRT